MISVVIPAYNEEKCIASCLASLEAQDIKEPYEVIVVDNTSTDKTKSIALSFRRKLNLSVISEKLPGRGAARATGFSHAKGRIIFSTDADTRLPVGWLTQFCRILDNEKYAAVTGPNVINDCPKLTKTIYDHSVDAFIKGYNFIFGNSTLNGFNFAVKREAYLLTAGFSPRLNAQEDLDLGRQIAKIGEIKFAENITVVSSGRRFKHGLIKGLIAPALTLYQYYRGKKEPINLPDAR